MRVFILIALLCNVAFSALYLNGAEYTQIVTINHSQVAETSSDFLFQLKIPRVGALLTAVESADDVAFTNVNDTTRRARWVVYTPDTIFMYSHIAVSSTVDTSYRIQYGKSLNEVNSSSTFTNCGINNAWVDSTVDFASGNNLSGGNQPTYETGKFNRSLVCTRATNSTYGASILSGKTAFTVSMILKPTESFVLLQIPFADRNNAVSYLQMEIQNNAMYVKFNGGTEVVSVTSLPSYMSIGNYSLVSFVYDGSVPVASIYINGVLRGSTIDMPSSMSTYTGFVRTGFDGTSYGFRGEIDNLILRKSAVSPNYVSDQYNMLFNSSTFSTLGTLIATEFSAEMGIDTLTFTCSAENAITYQWYLDGAEMVGETDSVLVIYADSAFYSTAHTLYCLVNGSVISDSWVITTEFSAEMGIDTLRLVCSAENALTYQWYDNNVAVTGATDSVYTIYADSTFYSIKHVIYCLVNGSVISDSWIIRETSGFLQRLFQRNRGYGRGR